MYKANKRITDRPNENFNPKLHEGGWWWCRGTKAATGTLLLGSCCFCFSPLKKEGGTPSVPVPLLIIRPSVEKGGWIYSTRPLERTLARSREITRGPLHPLWYCAPVGDPPRLHLYGAAAPNNAHPTACGMIIIHRKPRAFRSLKKFLQNIHTRLVRSVSFGSLNPIYPIITDFFFLFSITLLICSVVHRILFTGFFIIIYLILSPFIFAAVVNFVCLLSINYQNCISPLSAWYFNFKKL